MSGPRFEVVCERKPYRVCLLHEVRQPHYRGEVLGGTPVFKGTRVPLKTLFDYLEQNYSLEEFLACFPSVTREVACQVLERSETALLSQS